MLGWKPKIKLQTLAASERKQKLIITPPGKVTRSVRASLNLEEASVEGSEAGLDLTLLGKFKARITCTHRRINAVVVEVDENKVAGLEKALEERGYKVERSMPMAPLLDLSVPQMSVDSVWRLGFTGRGIRVGVADTGIDASYSDFKGRLIDYDDFTDSDLSDKVGHGTHVCGIIAGAGSRYRGVAPAACLIVAKVLTEAGGTSADVIAGLSWLSTQKVDVINLSLGGAGNPGDPLARECEALVKDGIIVCVAAGNEGPDPSTIGSPGCAPSVITVGAVDKNDRLASYSSRGPVKWRRRIISKPDLLGVGGGVGGDSEPCLYMPGIISAKSRKMGKSPCDVQPAGSIKKYIRMSGTSMATPHVTGVVALLVESFRRSQLPFDPASIKDILQRSCKKLKCTADEQGAGRVDSLSAIRLAQTCMARVRPRRSPLAATSESASAAAES